MSDEAERLFENDAAMEILRRRADSLAHEAEEEVADDRVGVLLFQLGDETYGVPISDVREIYQEYTVTPIPCVPEYVHGVINIRGEIVSVTGLAELMNLLPGEGGEGPPQAIVVKNDECVTAVEVDEIGDIVDVALEAVEPPVSMIGKSQAEFVSGSIYVEDRLVGLINLERVLQPVGGAEKE